MTRHHSALPPTSGRRRARTGGVRDTFAEGGSTKDLLARYGLTAKDIVEAYDRARRVRERRTGNGSPPVTF